MTSNYQKLIKTNLMSGKDYDHMSEYDKNINNELYLEQKKREYLRILTDSFDIEVQNFSSSLFEKIYLKIREFWKIKEVREYFHQIYWTGKYKIFDNYE